MGTKPLTTTEVITVTLEIRPDLDYACQEAIKIATELADKLSVYKGPDNPDNIEYEVKEITFVKLQFTPLSWDNPPRFNYTFDILLGE